MLERERGLLHIGLYKYQEVEWIKSIREYGIDILNKSLLTQYQKTNLIKAIAWYKID
jgi:hypothetical protein